MGEKDVTSEYDEQQMRLFTKAVLSDLQALEIMLEQGRLENDVLRVGAEQELFLIDSSFHPAPLISEVIRTARDGRLTTEIGRFNVEANLTPREFKGSCLREMEGEVNELIGIVRRAAAHFGADVVLAGILPTIQGSDLTEKNLTPNPRYNEINRVVTKLHGDNRVIHIKGLDELQLTLQDTFIEFCNTSFQVHLQVGIDEFVTYYNWAQAIAGPVLASAVNSPLLLNHRLWHETRIALFQHATDTRSLTHQQRNQTPRVNFGERWVGDSILDMLREDAVRFRVLLTQAVSEDSLETVRRGGIPGLLSWRLHNGTIWRWNRPCYGVVNGKPGLRIEGRFLPAGPSVVDEMANAAFFLGLLMGMPAEFGEASSNMAFDDAKRNFYNAARHGMYSQMRWFDGKNWRVGRLILEELLPRARRGLEIAGIDQADRDRLLRIIEERVTAEKTGSKWMVDSLAGMDKAAKPNVRMRSLTASMKALQDGGQPMHLWPLASIPTRSDWIDNYKHVEQFMITDLYTVRPEDVLELAASLMHWRRVRHVPVEDDDGRLVGLISHRDILELLALGKVEKTSELAVRDVMKMGLYTVSPETSTLDALRLMREKQIGCLPVVVGERLVGIITAYDFLTVSAKLFEVKLSEMLIDDMESGEEKDECTSNTAA